VSSELLVVRPTAFLILAALLSACARSQPTLTVAFATAPGLQIGAPLRFRGVAIGHVAAIDPQRELTHVVVALDRRDAPLRSADRIALVPDGVFGVSSLEIVLGPNAAPLVPEHATLTAVPPDSIAILRDAIVRAVAKEAIDQWRQRDSTVSPRPAAPRSRP
jgi:ABC-type transporter Mla subunit MlaD